MTLDLKGACYGAGVEGGGYEMGVGECGWQRSLQRKPMVEMLGNRSACKAGAEWVGRVVG